MRALAVAVLLGLAFAGCAGPGPDRDARDFVTCPQWITPTFDRGDGTVEEQTLLVATHEFFFNRTSFHVGPHEDGGPLQGQEDSYDPYQHGLGAGRLEHGGRPLDAVRIEIDAASGGHGVVDGVVQLRAQDAEGAVLAFREPGPTSAGGTEVLELGPGDGNRTVFLSLSDPAGEAEPRPVRVQWIFVPDRDGDPDSPSGARLEASYVPMYRNWDGPCPP